MSWEAWVTLGLIGAMALALIRGWASPDTVLLGGMTVLMGLRVFSDRFPSASDAVAGFGHRAVVTIGVLFVVAEGVRQTGVLHLLTRPLLGQPASLASAQARLMIPVAGLSAFLNNTPIVAMLMPVVSDWSRQMKLAPSKLFIPLSYAAIMGGSCTLIGTATNVYVYGEVEAAKAELGVELGMFTIAAVGVPAAVLGIGYILLVSRWLLPDHGGDERVEGRRYTIEMTVDPDGPVAGRTIEQAGLRNLSGAYLLEIDRNGERRVAVGPEQVLRGGDRLVFAGLLDSAVDLQKIRGLHSPARQVFDHHELRSDRRMVEVVVSDTCPLVGKSIREGRFRGTYGGAVVAVHRGDEHLSMKIGDIVLRAGDALLIEAPPGFADRHRYSRDFFIASHVADSQPPRYHRAPVAAVLMVLMVVAATTGLMQLVTAALLAGGLMILSGCCSPAEARAAINWRVLLMMGAALGVASALESTGAAAQIAAQLTGVFAPMGPRAVLVVVYLIAMGFTSIIGPVPTAGLLFPVVKAVALSQGYDFTPFAITLMMTAAASFASPSAYQTNLMVYTLGGYKPMDYVRIGLPLNLIVMAVTVILAPILWPFLASG